MATQPKSAKKAETKADKFTRLAQVRVGNAIKQLRNCQKLANRNGYDWTPAQCDKIMAAITAEVRTLEERLYAPAGEKAKAGPAFTF